MKQFLINLEQNQHDVLRMVAYEKKMSMAAIMREAFELYLKQNDAEYYNGIFNGEGNPKNETMKQNILGAEVVGQRTKHILEGSE